MSDYQIHSIYTAGKIKPSTNFACVKMTNNVRIHGKRNDIASRMPVTSQETSILYSFFSCVCELR